MRSSLCKKSRSSAYVMLIQIPFEYALNYTSRACWGNIHKNQILISWKKVAMYFPLQDFISWYRSFSFFLEIFISRMILSCPDWLELMDAWSRKHNGPVQFILWFLKHGRLSFSHTALTIPKPRENGYPIHRKDQTAVQKISLRTGFRINMTDGWKCLVKPSMRCKCRFSIQVANVGFQCHRFYSVCTSDSLVNIFW